MMRYLSVCSGIEAATVAWHPLGWTPAAFSEIEAFPRAVLRHHYTEVPLHGDFTTIRGDEYGPVDLVVGGTPCQAFSVAGLRKGFADHRGNLTLGFVQLLGRVRPRWVVWENVPGVLSLDGGRAFGAFLGGLAECGYGFAYRVLDAQYFGLAQRRARVFVVAHLGDWRRAAAVLFEPESLSGHPAPRREAGEDAARPLAAGSPRGSGYRNDADTADNLIAATLRVPSHGATWRGDGCDNLVPVAYGGNNTAGPIDVATAVNAHGGPHGRLDFETETFVAFDTTQSTSATNRCNPQPGDPCHPLAAGAHPPAIAFSSKDHGADAGGQVAVAFSVSQNSNGFAWEADVAATLQSRSQGASSNQFDGVRSGAAVRRLTPRECERLQGFPDDYTLIPYRKRLAADGPRYKALGNSMAVPVMRWIGARIDLIEHLAKEAA